MTTPAPGYDRVALLDLLDRRLSESDIGDVCLDLGIDPANLAGDTKRARLRDLINRYQAREDLPTLFAAIHRSRTDIVLPGFPAEVPPTPAPPASPLAVAPPVTPPVSRRSRPLYWVLGVLAAVLILVVVIAVWTRPFGSAPASIVGPDPTLPVVPISVPQLTPVTATRVPAVTAPTIPTPPFPTSTIVSIAATPPASATLPPTPTPAPTNTALPSATPWPIDIATTYDDGTGRCTLEAHSMIEPGHPGTIQLTFTPSGPDSFCGWIVQLPAPYDARQKMALTFWVRGKQGDEKFEVGIKDVKTPPGGEPKRIVSATAQWAPVSIPLTEFSKRGQDLSTLDNFSVNFGSPLGSGIIYVDNFVFAGP